VTPYTSMLAQLRCPTTPDATVMLTSSGLTSETTLWKTMSRSEGHAASLRCLFGFHPSMNVGASSASSLASLVVASASQYGARSVMAFSIGAAFISLKLNRKLLYPPTRNSPGCSRTSPNVTRGPTASMSRIISEHGTARWPPSDPSAAVGISCAPQHMNTKRSGSATSVAPVISSTTTTRENSNATVTPRRLTGESRALVTTTETYISRAAAAPPDVAASTAPTRTRSSDGREVHVVTANLSAPEVRSGQPPAGAASAGVWRRRRGTLFVAMAAEAEA